MRGPYREPVDPEDFADCWAIVEQQTPFIRALVFGELQRRSFRLGDQIVDAEDVVQAALVEAFYAVARWNPTQRSSLFAWIATRVRYAVLDVGYPNRKPLANGRRPESTVSLDVPLEGFEDARTLADVLADPRDEVGDLEDRLALEQQLAALRAGLDERTLWLLDRRLDGLRQVDVAAELGVTESRICQMEGELHRKGREIAA